MAPAGRSASPGQAHELPLAEDLVDCLPDIPGVGDKGYASHAFRQFIWDQAGDPDQEKRSARGLPRVDLQQLQPRRAPVGAPQGMARCRNPLRENRLILHGRALPCRHLRLDQERLQAITGPSSLSDLTVWRNFQLTKCDKLKYKFNFISKI